MKNLLFSKQNRLTNIFREVNYKAYCMEYPFRSKTTMGYKDFQYMLAHLDPCPINGAKKDLLFNH